jgi:hypothetical protein
MCILYFAFFEACSHCVAQASLYLTKCHFNLSPDCFKTFLSQGQGAAQG